MTHRFLLTLCIAITAGAASALAADKPNVIVIYTDDQGFGDASCLNPEIARPASQNRFASVNPSRP